MDQGSEGKHCLEYHNVGEEGKWKCWSRVLLYMHVNV